MKIIELTNKVLLPITNEEQELLEKIGSEPIAKARLEEREQLLANQLTMKDVLVRTNQDGKIYYKKRNTN